MAESELPESEVMYGEPLDVSSTTFDRDAMQAFLGGEPGVIVLKQMSDFAHGTTPFDRAPTAVDVRNMYLRGLCLEIAAAEVARHVFVDFEHTDTDADDGGKTLYAYRMMGRAEGGIFRVDRTPFHYEAVKTNSFGAFHLSVGETAEGMEQLSEAADGIELMSLLGGGSGEKTFVSTARATLVALVHHMKRSGIMHEFRSSKLGKRVLGGKEEGNASESELPMGQHYRVTQICGIYAMDRATDLTLPIKR